MKRIRSILVAIICVALVCGCFYYANYKMNHSTAEEGELSEVEKLITKDLETNYPNTPREVIKLYNRILKCFYDQDYTDEEFEELCDQSLLLFDDELRANNPKASYEKSVKSDIEEFNEDSKVMNQTDVCDSNDVQYLKDGDDQVAYVDASYFIKNTEDKTFEKTYETYVLRKDSDGNWKILSFYLSDRSSEEEE